MPRHINPNDPARTATAPYNFVPLPNKIFSVEQGIEVNGKKIHPWKMHDRFVPGTHSGWIDLKITTLTPLFVRGPITQTDGEWDKRDARLRYEPYVNKDGVPVIPGSSLRGMIRNIVETLSFSKISPVTDEKPFFRTVAADRIGIAYRNRMIRSDQKPRGGYVRKRQNQWDIVPAVEVLRVHQDKLNNCDLNVPASQSPNYYPNWNGQQKPCWYKRNSLKSWMVEDISLEYQADCEEGVLVLTGSAPNKQYEFVFFGELPGKRIKIPEEIWLRFHDDDQLTQWQENAFLKDKPTTGCRKAKGYLRDGEPVFYLTDNLAKSEENPEGLLFFGRAQMFRYPYDQSPLDLIPEDLKNAKFDIAEILFGKVSQAGNIKGRVFFENLVATGNDSEWLENIIVPHILTTPKVTCFQHYLTQDGTKSKENLTTYLAGDHTTIRGTKYYWHRWDNIQHLEAAKEPRNQEALLKDLMSTNPRDSQHTLIQSVKDNVVFIGRICFENLCDVELGALLAALSLPDGCAHKLGMGKPLGFGSIRVNPQLYLLDLKARYSSWEKNGAQGFNAHDFINAFEAEMLAHARSSDETIDENKSGLQSISRLQVLFCLLSWQTRPQYSATAYQQLGQFRARPVLPTPHKVVGQQEPVWQEDPPLPSQQETDTKSKKSLNPSTSCIFTTKVPQSVKPIGKGQTREGTLISKDKIWVAMFEGDHREAVIVNSDKIPKNANGSMGEFYIMEQSKKAGIRVRFEKLVIKK